MVLTAFMDGFEGPTLNPFWNQRTDSGSITFPSTVRVHGGSQSVQLNSRANTGQKNIELNHLFPEPVFGRVSVWMYDTGADIASSNYIGLRIQDGTTGTGAGLFTQDYDLGPTDGGNYYYSSFGGGGATSIDRTEAWHHFEISAMPDSLVLKIDGTTVHSGPGGNRFDFVAIDMHGPSSRPAWVCYFDDFEAVYNEAGYLVTNTNDSGPGSLRQAILNANAIPGTDTIRFSIGTGAQTINLASPLPHVTDPVVMDGSTQPGSAGRPVIELNGAGAGLNANGLTITAGNSTVRGLVINGFASGYGITLISNGNVVEGSFIGTDLTGTLRRGNGAGLLVSGSNNRVGGTTPADGNVISGNGGHGIVFSGTGARDNVVQGNRIGLDVAGLSPVGNGYYGVSILAGASRITIGGTVPGAGNVISGNAQWGVGITSGSGTVVQGNIIGLDATGTVRRGNAWDGVAILYSTNNLIGGTTAGARNIISGNAAHGVRIEGAAASDNVVQGNYIGTNASGSASAHNAGQGVLILGSTNNLIGGLTEEARNVISGNLGAGVQMVGPVFEPANRVQGNYIGTDSSGANPLGNLFGVYVHGNYSIVGGLEPGAGNVIAFNLNNGVFNDGTSNYAIRRNSIFGHGDIGIGGHNLPSSPTLASAISDGNTLLIEGTLVAAPHTTIEIEFFSNLAPHWTGFGEGQTYIGTTSVTTDSTGQASFSVPFTTSPAVSLWISATATHGNTSTSRFSNSVPVAAYVPRGVASVVINDGSAQRSRVTSLTITFSGIVTLDPGAFELLRQDGSAVTVNISSSVVASRTVAVLSFSGDDVIAGSLADGNYQLIIRADRIFDPFGRSLDGDGDGSSGGDRVESFFRLFGDSDGDRDVDDADLALFDSAFGTQFGDPSYLWYFDFGGDGDVHDPDLFAFQERHGTVLNP